MAVLRKTTRSSRRGEDDLVVVEPDPALADIVAEGLDEGPDAGVDEADAHHDHRGADERGATARSAPRPENRPTRNSTTRRRRRRSRCAKNISPNLCRVSTRHPPPSKAQPVRWVPPSRGTPTGRLGTTVRTLGPLRSTRRTTSPTASRLRPGGLDLVHGVLGALTRDPVRRLRPERARAHGARHLVRAVEAEHSLRVLEDRCGQLVDRGLQAGRREGPCSR